MTGQFTWASLGKADYAQAAALVASLPPTIRQQLDGVAREVLCRITFLSWRFALTSGRGRAYCLPSEQYLGKVTFRSVRTVQRAIVKLRRLGLLTWKRRGNWKDGWKTNLYSMGKSF